MGCDTDGGHKCTGDGNASDGNMCSDGDVACGNECTADGELCDGNGICCLVSKVYDDGNIGGEAYDGGGIYDVLVVQYQPPNLPELTHHHQSEQLALSILQTLAASALLFATMLQQSQSQGNWATVKH